MGTEPREVEIQGLALGGDGVGRLADGRVLFVPFTLPGERARVALTGEHARYCRGRLVELVRPAPQRVEPRCPLFGRCGGCQYQHLDSAAQPAAKAAQLVETLTRLGGCRDLPAPAPVTPSPHPYGYRNKLRLESVDGGAFGFFAVDNQTVLPVSACPLAMPGINQALPAACHAAAAGPRATRTLTVRQDATGTVAWHLGAGPPTERLLTEKLLGREVRVPQAGFWQVNPPVAQALLDTLQDWLAGTEGGTLIDAYAGVGAFSLALGGRMARRLVIEAFAPAIAVAKLNHAAWGLATDTRYWAQPTEQVLPRLLRSPHAAPCVVVLDPPRGGCQPAALDALRPDSVARLFYVSCHPATLARDLQRLSSRWRVRRLALFDMFPQTAHFETAVELVPR